MAQIIYGKNSVMEWLQSGLAVEKIWLSDPSLQSRLLQKFTFIPVVHFSKARLTALVGNSHHQGIAARIEESDLYVDTDDLLQIASQREEPPLIGLLDGITDPQNLGAIIRSADAAGIHGLIIPKDKSATLTPAVFKASAGAAAHIHLAKVVNLARSIEALKENGLWFTAADHRASKAYFEMDLKGATGIVLGSEGYGLRRLVRDKCDFFAAIPMAGTVNSLNVSAAASLFFFEARRQRLPAGT